MVNSSVLLHSILFLYMAEGKELAKITGFKFDHASTKKSD